MKVVLCLLVMVPGYVAAQTSGSAAQTVEAVLSDTAAEARFMECPAQIYETRRPSMLAQLLSDGEVWDYGMCEGCEDACWAECLERTAGACFGLALQLQETDQLGADAAAETLFSEACAAGMAEGCTNRAAAIPLAEGEAPSRAHTPACAAQTFELTCDAQDPWGCTMLGFRIMSGDGVAQDGAAALDLFDRACFLSGGAEETSLDRASAPCRAARRASDALRASRPGK